MAEITAQGLKRQHFFATQQRHFLKSPEWPFKRDRTLLDHYIETNPSDPPPLSKQSKCTVRQVYYWILFVFDTSFSSNWNVILNTFCFSFSIFFYHCLHALLLIHNSHFFLVVKTFSFSHLHFFICWIRISHPLNRFRISFIYSFIVKRDCFIRFPIKKIVMINN